MGALQSPCVHMTSAEPAHLSDRQARWTQGPGPAGNNIASFIPTRFQTGRGMGSLGESSANWPSKRNHRQSPRPSGQMLIGGFCMRKRAVISTAATVHLSKPLESFLFGFSYPGEGGVQMAWEAVYSTKHYYPPIFPPTQLIRIPHLRQILTNSILVLLPPAISPGRRRRR
ncbi:hypothetical protein L873DRAFT_1498809 [Choiromyces venosus 120613-1]|uniref:Uncharacterized protein n=1 Tax=Choiromyces venosus 120613-1 TaxID=1336337 RepID=A0A3N4J6I9_9PEZI|nr:hypothetical protein L873DRAFT_1498809 [Choiromyces venosus 120613-1]